MSNPKEEVWDATFTRMWNTGIIPNFLTRVVVLGYSRTGKSTHIHKLTKSERITFHEMMPLEDLIGGLTLVNGTTQWVDGPAVRALRHGKPLQIDELNEMPIECRTMVYALMDSPAGITLPTGERVEAAKGYCVIATMNPSPEVLPHPVYDRVDCFLKATCLSEGIKTKLGPHLAERAEREIVRGQTPLTWERPPSVNAFLAYKALRDAGVATEEAVFMLGFRGRALSDFLTIVAVR